MKQILIIGMNPYTVDFSQPGFMPGLTAEKVEQGILAEQADLKTHGYNSEVHWINTGDMDQTSLQQKLSTNNYEGVLVGAGVRVPPSNFMLFEKVINTIHEYAPASKLIFNTNPTDTRASIERWV